MKKQFTKKSTISLFKKKAPKDNTYLNIEHHPEFIGRVLSYPPSLLSSFTSNSVKTSKYSWLTWAPKSLLWQFQRIPNIYFLVMSVLSGMSFSPKSPFSMAGTFAAVLFFTMLKEGYEDYFRHKQDNSVNSVKSHRLDSASKLFVDVRTDELKVGDIVIVYRTECLPADLVLLSSFDSRGKAYVNTVNLDGENNLKEKNSVVETKDKKNGKDFSELRVLIECDHPSPAFDWNCNFQIFEKEKVPLSQKNLLLKGCTLENVEFVYGIVVYTGNDTKIIQNSKKSQNKVSNVLRKMNKILYSVFVFQMAICILFAVMSVELQKSLEKHSYLSLPDTNESTGYLIQFLTFWVAYSHLIPISLYVALEVLKLFLAFLINQDKDFFFQSTSAKCKTSDLLEELGQVEFVFSDKTGTLTCNEMIFRKCFINGVTYGKTTSEFGHENSQEAHVIYSIKHNEHLNLLNFCKILALCNSVIPKADNEDVVYQASSPDELALVQGAKNLGIKLLEKNDNFFNVSVNGKTETWEVLAEVPFTSDRKRMSIIVRNPITKKLVLMTKGADNVIIPLLNQADLKDLNFALKSFSNEGLRCLVMCHRSVSGSEFHDWHEKWKKVALSNSSDKEKMLEQVALEIEKDLKLVGCSAIEDRLQDGVPDSINLLMQAGIRIWVLTGDKEETAIEIAKNCNLIQRDCELILLSSLTKEDLSKKLVDESEKYHLSYLDFKELQLVKKSFSVQLSIVIDGSTLAWVLADQTLKNLFFRLGFVSISCICCRVSPSQKAEVVKLAKTYGKWVTLSIGDGANDVSMILEAHIGIGISGKEGTQAVQSADLAIGQFRFLSKILLVHGRWCYKRVSWFICYYFYKNMAVVFTEIWFALYNGFSGQIFFMDWLPMLYNSFWTSWPCLIAYGLEQDIDSVSTMSLPGLYKLGQRGVYFNIYHFWKWVVFAFWHGSFTFWICVMSTGNSVSETGKIQTLFWVSTLAFSVIINIVTLKLYLENMHWTWVSVFAGVASLAIYYLSILGLSTDVIATVFQNESRGLVVEMFSNRYTWVVVVILPFIALLPDYLFACASQIICPSIVVKCRSVLYKKEAD